MDAKGEDNEVQWKQPSNLHLRKKIKFTYAAEPLKYDLRDRGKLGPAQISLTGIASRFHHRQSCPQTCRVGRLVRYWPHPSSHLLHCLLVHCKVMKQGLRGAFPEAFLGASSEADSLLRPMDREDNGLTSLVRVR
eukprot:scaffold27928_cov16-Tisochrysis_lutea.AAC.2